MRLALGRRFEADAVILAVGLGPPSQLPGVAPDVLSARTHVGNPWRGDLPTFRRAKSFCADRG